MSSLQQEHRETRAFPHSKYSASTHPFASPTLWAGRQRDSVPETREGNLWNHEVAQLKEIWPGQTVIHECPVVQQETHPTDQGCLAEAAVPLWGQDGQASLTARSEALRPGVGETGQIPAISDPTEIFTLFPAPIPIHNLLEQDCTSLLALHEPWERLSGVWLQEGGQCLLPHCCLKCQQHMCLRTASAPLSTCTSELPLLLFLSVFQLRVVYFHSE